LNQSVFLTQDKHDTTTLQLIHAWDTGDHFAIQVELHTNARFVGEPTGSRPNFVGESSIIGLPYSGLRISISSRYHQNGGSNDKRMWIAPDIPAAPDLPLWNDGRDGALEALLK
jgi:hypothetical protein